MNDLITSSLTPAASLMFYIKVTKVSTEIFYLDYLTRYKIMFSEEDDILRDLNTRILYVHQHISLTSAESDSASCSCSSSISLITIIFITV